MAKRAKKKVGRPKKKGKKKAAKKPKKKAVRKPKKKKKQVVAPVKRHRRKKGSTLMGFCRCGCMIMEGDKIKKTIYVCPKCGKRKPIKNLKDKLSTESRAYNSKKDYLTDVVEHKVIDGV